MRKLFKKTTALTLAATMIMGMTTMAFAAEGDSVPAKQDNNSNLTNAGNVAGEGVDYFYIIKDYASFDKTYSSESTDHSVDAPNSLSPAETFTYTISPYAVWNAGNEKDTTTPITSSTMPMLEWDDDENDETATKKADTTTRELTVTQFVEKGKALKEDADNNSKDLKQKIVLPKYATVGDYWYKLVETDGEITGVLYGTNSSAGTEVVDDNGGFDKTYYIHVQVTENKINDATGEPELVNNVTIHQDSPDAMIKMINAKLGKTEGNKLGIDDITNAIYNNSQEYMYTEEESSKKVNAVENTYYAGELVIKKTVTGNAGDKDKYFKVTVVFTKPAGTIVNSDITFSAIDLVGTNYEKREFTIAGQYKKGKKEQYEIRWDLQDDSKDKNEATATVVFYVNDNATVTISNIPYGINYKVTEELPENDTYTNAFALAADTNEVNEFDGAVDDGETLLTADGVNAATEDEHYAQGSITDKNDTVTITNNKETIIDIGVILSNAPYIALLLVAGAAFVVFARRNKKNMIEE